MYEQESEQINQIQIQSYLDEIENAESYWEATKRRSSWHFDYTISEAEDTFPPLFRVAGRIECDFNFLLEHTGKAIHTADEISPVIKNSEHTDMKNWGYRNWGHAVSDPDERIKEIASLLQLTDPEVKLHTQSPGYCKWMHLDSICSYIRRSKIQTMEEVEKIHRFFVMLTPWEPGHFIIFGNSIFKQWKAGDIVWFDWRNAPHATANAGHHDRQLLRVTGIVNERSQWLLENQFKILSLTY
jgi:hypothetical protein